MKRHKKDVHEKLREIECKVCFAKFIRKTDLTRHGVFCCHCHECKTQFSSISEFCKHPCPRKEVNEPAPKRSKHDDTLIVDDVPTSSSNQSTGSGKRDLKPKKRKIARKPRQKSWKQIEVNETEKLKEENLSFFTKVLVQ